MTAFEFAGWKIDHPDASYENLVTLFECLDIPEQDALRTAMQKVADRGN